MFNHGESLGNARVFMKKQVFAIASFFLLTISQTFATGVAIVDVSKGYYLKLIDNDIQVRVENQVAIVTSTQTFKNFYNEAKKVKFGFPMPEDGSATRLDFYLNGHWYTAKFSASPQDTSLPHSGEEMDANLKEYLGDTPLYYNFEERIQPGDTLIVRLKYVQLLHYRFGRVNFEYKADYRLLQTAPVVRQSFAFYLDSDRSINFLELQDITPDSSHNDGHHAALFFTVYEQVPKYNFHVQYELAANELGLFSMSTFLPDTTVPDKGSPGFFTFIAEPDPSENAAVIKKVFTLIVDRSGSMAGTKIEQARDAAKFIVQHLNEGDRFNIVDFSSTATAFRSQHVPFNQQNMDDALHYIDGFIAYGGTNISQAFDLAIPQFQSADDSTANIIIFFTDGQPTFGITNIDDLLNHINQTVQENHVKVSIFAFGIGDDANKQFLARLAEQHDGSADFLGDQELEEKITQFYMTIRNPVLLSTQLSVTPASIVKDTHPEALPNLYKGQQLIVSGRYNEPGTVTVKLSGTAFGKPVEYSYQMQLSDSAKEKYQFLTKIWAKQKIEDLLKQYYTLDENSTEAQLLKEEVIGISMNFGVLSPFTSLSGATGIHREEIVERRGKMPGQFEVLGNYPNPFNPATTIRLRVNMNWHGLVTVKIYNSLGELVRVLVLRVNGAGVYRVIWDGRLANGQMAPSGGYVYIVHFGDKAVLGGKMMLVK